MNNILRAIISWCISLWIGYVFIGSLFYKFTDAAEPIHIFSTIGLWLSGFLGDTVGGLFADYGAYLIGVAELLVSLILLAPIVFPSSRAKLHLFGGLLASLIMAGAVFFHLFTPLGWIVRWQENGQPQVDAGLANAALSILILGIVMAVINNNKRQDMP